MGNALPNTADDAVSTLRREVTGLGAQLAGALNRIAQLERADVVHRATPASGTAPRVWPSNGQLARPTTDPDIRGKDPRAWKGAPMTGKRFSQAPPEYLLLFAELKRWQAGKDEESGAVTGTGKPLAPYRRSDALLAEQWADYLTSIAQATPAKAPTSDVTAADPDAIENLPF